MTDRRPDLDVIVLGAGAAGQMCAIHAGRRGRRVLLLDHWRRIGERIRVSGGGRCNFTNRSVSAANYLSGNPHFCRSALSRFTPDDFVALMDQHGIAWEEREQGQLFCCSSATDVVRLLSAECDAAGVQLAAPCEVASVASYDRTATGRPGRFSVATSAGTFTCDALVVATGGLAVPKLGATPLGYRVAEQFGLPVVAPQPGLVPLALAPADRRRLTGLAGVSFPATLTCQPPHGPSFTGHVLITHHGLSGPAVLQLSNYWQTAPRPGGTRPVITLDLLPGIDAAAWLEAQRGSRALLSNVLATTLPQRFAREWCAIHGLDQPLNQISRTALGAAACALSGWRLAPAGTLGFDKAEVTLGGVDTHGLSSRTMESIRQPGLYFVGEVVDVTGWLGGYNFQWAWSSGWAAGQHV